MALSIILKEIQIHLSEVALEPYKPLQPQLFDKIDSRAIGMFLHAELFLELTYLCLAREFL